MEILTGEPLCLYGSLIILLDNIWAPVKSAANGFLMGDEYS